MALELEVSTPPFGIHSMYEEHSLIWPAPQTWDQLQQARPATNGVMVPGGMQVVVEGRVFRPGTVGPFKRTGRHKGMS